MQARPTGARPLAICRLVVFATIVDKCHRQTAATGSEKGITIRAACTSPREGPHHEPPQTEFHRASPPRAVPQERSARPAGDTEYDYGANLCHRAISRRNQGTGAARNHAGGRRERSLARSRAGGSAGQAGTDSSTPARAGPEQCCFARLRPADAARGCRRRRRSRRSSHSRRRPGPRASRSTCWLRSHRRPRRQPRPRASATHGTRPIARAAGPRWRRAAGRAVERRPPRAR